MLHIDGIVPTSSTKKLEPFFKLQIRFRIDGRKPNIIQTNSEAWILLKVQCVLYQLIGFDTLYKLIGSFFFNFVIIFELLTEKQKIFKSIEKSLLRSKSYNFLK